MPFYLPCYWLPPYCRPSVARAGARSSRRRAAAVVSNLTTLRRAGVKVVWFSLFARDKTTHGGPDVVRSMADHVVHRQLRIADFFGAGGRLVDQWPLYASYFGLVGSRPARATFGPSSLHYSAPARLRTASCRPTSAPCAPSLPSTLSARAARGWVPPCGLGVDNADQVSKYY